MLRARAQRAWVSRCRTQRASTSADAGTGRVSRRRNGDGRASGHLPDRAAQGAGSLDTTTGCAMGWPALRTSTQSSRSPGRGFGAGSRDWRPWFMPSPHGCGTPAERVRGSGRRSGELLLQSGRQPPTLRPSVGIPRGKCPDGRDASGVAESGRGRCKSLRGSAYQALHSCSSSQVRNNALFTMRSFPSFTDGSTPR